MLRARAPGHRGFDGRGIDSQLAIETGLVLPAQRVPIGTGPVPGRALGRVGPRAQVIDSLVVGGDQPGKGRELHGHIAQGHAALNTQSRDRGPGELDGVTAAAARSVTADKVQDHVFGADAKAQFALENHAQRFRAAHAQGLGDQRVFGLAGADAPGQGAESALRAGVTVGTHQGHARLHHSLLR